MRRKLLLSATCLCLSAWAVTTAQDASTRPLPESRTPDPNSLAPATARPLPTFTNTLDVPSAVGADPGSMGASDFGGQDREDLARAEQARELVRRWKAAKPESRPEIEEQLSTSLTATFDARQRAHEREVMELEEKVRQLREQVERRTSQRQQIVDFRLKQLLREAEGLGWGGTSEVDGGIGVPGGVEMSPLDRGGRGRRSGEGPYGVSLRPGMSPFKAVDSSAESLPTPRPSAASPPTPQ